MAYAAMMGSAKRARMVDEAAAAGDVRKVQQLVALAGGDRKRLRRSRTLRHVETGHVGLMEALTDPDLDSMTIVDLLRRLPNRSRMEVSPRRSNANPRQTYKQAERILKAAKIGPLRRVDALTVRQRHVLVAHWEVIRAQ